MVKNKYEITEVDGVHRIKIDVPFGVKFVSLYLFTLDDKTILIDSGLNMGQWKKSLLSAFQEIKISIQDIDYCIITHVHTDHVGLAQFLKKQNPKLNILMHDITHELLKWETSSENLEELEEKARDTATELKKYGLNEEHGERIIQFFTYWPRFLEY